MNFNKELKMPTKKLYHEIIQDFQNAKTKQEKIDVLKKNGDFWFQEFLNFAFNPAVKFDIKKIPTYAPAIEPEGLNYSNLNLEVRKLYLFIPGHPKYKGPLPDKKRDDIFVNMLQSVNKEEAKLLEMLIMKKFNIKSLTPKLVKEAFPNMPFSV